MATSSNSCGICNLRHISKPTLVWCSDCNEGLCDDCKEHHSLLKATRDHNIIPFAEYQKLPSFITNIAMHCNEHDEKYLLFCKKHDQLLCRKCVISETHRECKEISTFEDVVLNAKKSVAFTEIESSLQELKENMSLILEDRQKNLSTISVSKEKLRSQISAFRQQINHHLDEIQDHFIAALNKTVENSTQQINDFMASLEEKQREIDACIEDVEIIKNHATDLQTFLGTKELGNKLNEKEKDLQSWIDGGSLGHTSISFQLNNLLQNFSEETATFGKPIVDVQSCKIQLQRRKEGQAQLMKVDQEPKRLVEHITLELKAKFDTTATNVSGCCILPCGKLVVSNYSPSYLTLFAPDGKFEKKNYQHHA
ncbi:putative leucine-rich repeat-containing protein DDB_G0290503 [Mytilus edulis]|uniref:putative leucine-rich repeat-containing protein DDB_G0290503 n=1 Tax=Mytilus edulis TaxID=6550 RepID=UPI0039F03D3D